MLFANNNNIQLSTWSRQLISVKISWCCCCGIRPMAALSREKRVTVKSLVASVVVVVVVISYDLSLYSKYNKWLRDWQTSGDENFFFLSLCTLQTMQPSDSAGYRLSLTVCSETFAKSIMLHNSDSKYILRFSIYYLGWHCCCCCCCCVFAASKSLSLSLHSQKSVPVQNPMQNPIGKQQQATGWNEWAACLFIEIARIWILNSRKQCSIDVKSDVNSIALHWPRVLIIVSLLEN